MVLSRLAVPTVEASDYIHAHHSYEYAAIAIPPPERRIPETVTMITLNPEAKCTHLSGDSSRITHMFTVGRHVVRCSW